MVSQSGIGAFQTAVCGREHATRKGLAARTRHTPLAVPLSICNNRKIHAQETRSALIGFARYNVWFILVVVYFNTISDNTIDILSYLLIYKTIAMRVGGTASLLRDYNTW
jgi:hypothetical protein